MKISFYVSNTGTRVRNILKQLSKPEYSEIMEMFPIDFIYLDNNTEKSLFTDLCNQLKINFYSRDINSNPRESRGMIVSQDLHTYLEKHKTDYLFVFGGKILKGKLLQDYNFRIINFHPSVLPAFPGIKSIDQAVEYGSLVMGNTVHFIDQGVDTGPIIMQNIFPAREFKDYDEVLNKQIPMFYQVCRWLKQNRVSINGRIVEISDADYNLNEFIPNLEFPYEA